ncbi:MAG: family 16 glycosylhydrolase [Bacteroidetes bacterium]|nr:family 16 glycosylhydrolase [Bacteroidota bacterium]
MRTWLGFFLVLLSLACHAQQDSLIWSDEFNGSGVPDTTWSYDLGTNNGWGNSEIELYTSSTQNVRQDSGKLIVEARKQGYTWTSARIKTQKRFNFTYGKIVFSARLPVGSGTWPALWLLGESITSSGWPACGEIDVMENAGKNPRSVRSSLHTISSSGNTVNTNAIMVNNTTTQFHEYQAVWTPEKIQFSVDGILFYTYNPATKTNSNWPFKKPFFIIINLAMGGTFGSDPKYETNGLKNGVDPALNLARMELDYVRVYKLVYPASVEDPPSGDGSLNKQLFAPNPSSGKINLLFPLRHPGQGIIYNMMGVDVFRFQINPDKTDIDISFLPKGIYLLAITSGGEKRTQKLILQ